MGKDAVLLSLAQPAAQAVEIALGLALGYMELDGHRQPQEQLKYDLGPIGGQQVELKTEGLRDCLVTGEPGQQESVGTQGCVDGHGLVRLGEDVGRRWHRCLLPFVAYGGIPCQ